MSKITVSCSACGRTRSIEIAGQDVLEATMMAGLLDGSSPMFVRSEAEVAEMYAEAGLDFVPHVGRCNACNAMALSAVVEPDN